MVLPGAHSYYINICIEEVMSKETRVPLITKPIKTRRLLYILFFSELLIGLLVSCVQTEPNYPLNPKVNRPKN